MAVEAAGAQGAGEVQFTLDPGSVTGTGGVFGGLAAGAYTVSAVDGAGCTASLAVEVNAPAELLITVDAVTDQTQNETDGAIAITVIGGTAPYLFTWTDASGASVATSEDLSGVLAGTYTVSVTDANGCTNEGFPVVVGLILGVEEEGAASVHLFPNPATASATLRIPAAFGPSDVYVFDAAGRCVAVWGMSGGALHPIDVSNWERGVYTVQIVSDAGRRSLVRFVKAE